MLRFHASWREEVGSVLVILGVGLMVFGAIDLLLDDDGIVSATTAWMCVLLSPLLVLPGLWLHVTRSRRRTNIEVPPPAPGQHDPPHRPSSLPRR